MAGQGWRDLSIGDSRAKLVTVFGEPKEARGPTLIFGPAEDFKQIVADINENSLQGFTVHFSKPRKVSEIASEKEKFDVMVPGGDLALQKVRFISIPSKGWLLEVNQEGEILTLSVGKSWVSKRVFSTWSEATKQAWRKEK